MTDARPQFSLFQLLEMVTLVAITIAIDRLLRFPYLVWSVMAVGGLTGAYLAIRWTSHRPSVWNDIWLTIVTSAIATFLNAAAIGIMVAEGLRSIEYFNWTEDWSEFATAIGIVTFCGAVVGAFAFAGAKFMMAVPYSKSK